MLPTRPVGNLNACEAGVPLCPRTQISEWSAREVTFNRPPADIASWVPTERELRSSSRTSFPAPLLRNAFQVNKPASIGPYCRLRTRDSTSFILTARKLAIEYSIQPKPATTSGLSTLIHDVTDRLRKGANAVGLMLGNGFYGQNIAFVPLLSYGPPRARFVLEISYADGSTARVESDDNWRASTGPVLFDNIYLGETFDARRISPDWSRADFQDADWKPVEVMKAPTENLVEQQMEPMRKIRPVQPIAVRPAETGWIIDMGQNMTGWLQIRVNEAAGTMVKMRFAEHLMPDKKNIDTASTGIHVTGDDQTDIYICRGGGTESWEPRFTYHGFRYVQVEGLSQTPDLKDFTGWLVRTDVERIGSFECADPLINRFYNVSIWTIEDNLQGIIAQGYGDGAAGPYGAKAGACCADLDGSLLPIVVCDGADGVGRVMDGLQERGLAQTPSCCSLRITAISAANMVWAGKWLMYEPSLRVPGFLQRSTPGRRQDNQPHGHHDGFLCHGTDSRWLEFYPQHGYVEYSPGKFEQLTVGVAQNATASLTPAAMNDPNQVYGRSYTQRGGMDNGPTSLRTSRTMLSTMTIATSVEARYTTTTSAAETTLRCARWLATRRTSTSMPKPASR